MRVNLTDAERVELAAVQDSRCQVRQRGGIPVQEPPRQRRLSSLDSEALRQQASALS